MRMLGQSLVRLLTDHLDVWQIHEVFYHNDPELIYDSDGVLEIPTKAKQQGNVRFIGSYFVKGKGGFWKRTEYDRRRVRPALYSRRPPRTSLLKHRWALRFKLIPSGLPKQRVRRRHHGRNGT